MKILADVVDISTLKYPSHLGWETNFQVHQ
jgi:hypothetical protein